MLEICSDWDGAAQAASTRHRYAISRPAITAKALEHRLRDFEPPILDVHCYVDVGYPWVHVVFDRTIGPDVALRVGAAIGELGDPDAVYLNSLRPQAVFFLIEPTELPPAPALPITRYGTRLSDIAAAWSAPRATEPRISPPARPRRRRATP